MATEADVGDARAYLARYLATLGGGEDLYQRQKNVSMFSLFSGHRLAGMRVLDIGCGGGYWTVLFSQMGAYVLGLDANPLAVEAAQVNLARSGLSSRQSNAVHCRFEDLETDGVFDLVFAKDVIEHVQDDGLFLARAAKLIKPGGHLALATQNAMSLNYGLEGLGQLLRGNLGWKGWDPEHVRFYTPWGLSRKVRQAGFRPRAWRSMYHFPYAVFDAALRRLTLGAVRLPIRPAFHALERWAGHFPLKYLGWNLQVLAEKRPSAGGLS